MGLRTKILYFILFALSDLAFAIPISVVVQSNLNFPVAVQGDPARTVNPGTGENARNGSFIVSGDPNVAFTIVLPTTAVMITGGGGVNETINMDNFQSFPLSASATLNNAGNRRVFIGARRAAISINQVPGSYVGTYIFTVVY